MSAGGMSEMSCGLPVDGIPDHHRDDLVVRFAAVDHRDSTDHARLEQDLRPIDRPFGEHADVQGILVPSRARRAQTGDTFFHTRYAE